MSEDYNVDDVRNAIISGLTAEADDDVIRMEMFKLGVPFNKINPVFKEVAIDGGFRADPKIVRAAIGKSLTDLDIGSLVSWDDVTDLASTVSSDVEGATDGQVIAALKRLAADAEMDFPVKPKGEPRSRGASKIKSMIVDTMNANADISTSDMMELIIADCGGEYRVRNALEYFNMYVPVIVAAKQGISLTEVKLEAPDKDGLVKQYGGTTSYTAGSSVPSDEDVEDELEDEEEAA